MFAESIAPASVAQGKGAWSRASSAYFRVLVALTLTIAVASFTRDRGQLLANISFWLFLIPFAVSIWRTQAGFLAALLLLTLSPALHQQWNVLAGPTFHAWAYPGVDCCLGFLAAWTLKGGLDGAEEVLDRFPSGPVLLFHAWMSLSAVIAAGRNVWQSASELSIRGLAYNLWLTRGISWHDDYYPLQDPFFYSVAVAMLFATWSLLHRGGRPLLNRLVWVVLSGAAANVAFALWQKATGMGWVNGQWSINANALWPDLHSFGAFMAAALGLGCGLLWVRGRSLIVWLAVVAAAIGLYLSGSRSTLFLVFAVVIVCAFAVSLKLRGWRRAAAVIGLIAVAASVHWVLDNGYRGVSYAFVEQQLDAPGLASLNVALSHRPEIWAAAVRMYLQFPFFGVGQGAFYRQSAVPEFSGSEFLVSMYGEGVHNEFLRILVELGPVGFCLMLFVAIPVIRQGSRNASFVSFFALAGIAIANVYTNALLVRELLALCAVFAGSYFWEADQGGGARWRAPAPAGIAAGALAVLVLAALADAMLSFGRFPFSYGHRCHEVHPLAEDGWTRGTLRVAVPAAAARADLTVVAERPDLRRRRLDLDVSVLAGDGSTLASARQTFGARDAESRPTRLELALPESPNGRRLLEVKPSNCYVPLNLGKTYDPRRLGVRVKELRFRTASGDEAR